MTTAVDCEKLGYRLKYLEQSLKTARWWHTYKHSTQIKATPKNV